MTDETPKKKPRRKRRSKAEIAAEKAAKEAAKVEATQKEAEGFEHVRVRDEHGHFVKDDPSTPENEAWEWKKKEPDPDEVFGSTYEKEIDEIIAQEPEPVLKTDEVITEMFEESVIEVPEVVKEEPVVSAEPTVTEPAPPVNHAGQSLEEIANRFKRKRAARRAGR